jgi:hypothetical protein
MNNKPNSLDKSEPLEKILPECPKLGQVLASPLGWSIKGRLICAAAAIALLWLSVAWAIGWL